MPTINDISTYQFIIDKEDHTPNSANVADMICPDGMGDVPVSEWDDFVLRANGGHYTQTLEWGLTKTNRGWKSLRLMALSQEHTIVAGAQILLRSIPFTPGFIGYLSKGPLFAEQHPDTQLVDLFIQKLVQLIKEMRVYFLMVQPSNYGGFMVNRLHYYGFEENLEENISPPGTVVIDLHQELDVIFKKMKKKTRHDVRYSEERCIEVYEGSTEEDVGHFYEILNTTSQRQDFLPDLENSIKKVWNVFYPKGWVKLFLAKIEDEHVSGKLVITFGDTVTLWRAGWNGKHSNKYPNVALQWAAIQWAKKNGYHYFDFAGIKTSAAKFLSEGKPLPDNLHDTVTTYKLGFGGDVICYPGTYNYIYNPLLNWGYRKIYPRIADSPFSQKLLRLISRR